MTLTRCVLLCCAFFSSTFVNAGVLPRSEHFKLDIVHYNDFHDRFEETSVSYPVCKNNDSSCLGGFARLYQEVMTLLKEKPDALLLNAGDTFQGTYWYTLMKWNITQKFINLLPNDAHAIGNHEFDDGVAGLAPYLAALRAPVLAANMDVTREPSLKNLFRPHIIKEKKGRKIGIIGLITPDTKMSSNSEKVIFLDPVQVVQKEAQLLTHKGVDIILVLSHCGLDVDKQIAKSVGENIDIIIGGHSHSLLWNGEAPSKEIVSGPYPVLVETDSAPDHKVLIVTASAFTKYLGNLTTFFNDQGELDSFEGVPVFLNRSIPENPEIKALMKPYVDKLHGLVNEVIGYTNDNLLGKKCGSQECALGDLIAESFLNATENISDLPHVVFLLRNMIRGSVEKGEITRGTVINTLPFTNKVITFTLPGRYLLEALERCMTNYWVAKPFNGPWMPQVAGMHVTLNTTDSSVASLLIKHGNEFHSVDPDKEYQVITLDFLLKGGNGFQMLKEHSRKQKYVGKDSELLEKYIRRVSPITPCLDNRLIVVN